MSTTVTLIIDNPADPDAFEAVYERVLGSARELPGLRRLESSKVWPKEDGTPTPAYRTLVLSFDDYDSASAAVSTTAAGELFGELAGSGTSFTGLFSEIEDR